MVKKSLGRMIAPDILKIIATIFVIVIHHKTSGSMDFKNKLNALFLLLFASSLIVGIFLSFKEYKKQADKKKCFLFFLLPPLSVFLLMYFRWFAVCIFLIVTGYLLAGSMEKLNNPIGEWYTKKNLICRVLRFYLPFAPVFVVGLLYKIFVLKYDYSVIEVMARFVLGGFKPGSYYITILAELVFVFPLIYIFIKKLRFTGVVICTLFTFLYDTACTYLSMSDVAYKFLIFRFTTHIAFGIYARISEFEKEKARNTIIFILGLIYAICCMYTDFYRPKIFFQWQEASFPTAFYIYPIIVWFINTIKNTAYTDSRLSKLTLTFANSTYHIFLVQLLYFTTFGFAFNEYVNNVAITMPLNVIITVPIGILYAKLISPFENSIISKLKSKL